ncbi:hypothetical protein BaRGS_00039739 [Batillaria attramentaria]|uniref:Uncharacterized protein n=1 Tax=Batillaria attramentaria TaxID=370345 RepID=A0ABD0J2D4_9CAEN
MAICSPKEPAHRKPSIPTAEVNNKLRRTSKSPRYFTPPQPTVTSGGTPPHKCVTSLLHPTAAHGHFWWNSTAQVCHLATSPHRSPRSLPVELHRTSGSPRYFSPPQPTVTSGGTPPHKCVTSVLRPTAAHGHFR